MANNNIGSWAEASRFEDMSNADLAAFIGGNVDPNTNRSDLIAMAIEANEVRRSKY